jgi:hypothetical protein
VGQSRGNREDRNPGSGHVVDAALAKALAEASSAGRWDVVTKLAAELEARRARAGNVLDLAEERIRRGR